jgi:hypothetical protein
MSDRIYASPTKRKIACLRTGGSKEATAPRKKIQKSTAKMEKLIR